ncbi:MAG: hypothetical protein GX230_02290, partial [Lentisphaerae bacterium]|nr:hypothetical protein [Lentisphaerota bacterium]
TGLGEYELRMHSPRMGRWLSRDPIEEEDFFNMYVYVENSFINKYDYLGQFGFTLQKTPLLGNCGWFSTYWDYFGLPSKGWIIQHVKRTFTIEKEVIDGCCVEVKEPKEELDDEFWEAFWYSGKKDEAGIEKRDTTSGYHGGQTKGTFTNAKTAIWYGMLKLNETKDCPKGFHKPGKHEQHEGTCIRNSAPDDWEEQYGSQQSVARSWVATWNCCEGSDFKTKLSNGF